MVPRRFAPGVVVLVLCSAPGPGSAQVELSGQILLRPPPPKPVGVMDVDGDGQNDVLFDVEWYGGWLDIDWAHPASSRFHLPGFDSERWVAIGDLDLDGWPDVIADDHSDRAIRYHLSASPRGRWAQTVLPLSSSQAMRSSVLADIDGDGDNDILNGRNVWAENRDGVGASWTVHPIDSGTIRAYPADVDGDGDIDVVPSRTDPIIVWYENDLGDGSSWSWNVVSLDDGVLVMPAARRGAAERRAELVAMGVAALEEREAAAPVERAARARAQVRPATPGAEVREGAAPRVAARPPVEGATRPATR